MATTIDTDYATQLNEIQQVPSSNRPTALQTLLSQIYKTSASEADLTAYLIALIGSTERTIRGFTPNSTDPINLTGTRHLLTDFITKLATHPVNGVKLGVAKSSIELLSSRVASFEEQNTQLKYVLADAYEADEEYTASARTLQTISFDAAQQASDNDKARTWIRIARCYLEEDDPTSAATYTNRAKNVMHNVTDADVRIFYHSAQARVLDSQRAFLDASVAYHTLSSQPAIDEDDRMQALSAAITCAVLAPAGPQRSRTLARLYKDERAPRVAEFSILEKIFLDRVLTAAEVSAFASKLAPHQRATTADGSTVLDRAVLEHNLLGASKIYRNIRIEQLGTLLNVDGDRAEQYAAQMIEQKRLPGRIDQVDGIIFFEDGAEGKSELRRWDANVQGIAEEVEKVASLIQSEYPKFYAANMV